MGHLHLLSTCSSPRLICSLTACSIPPTIPAQMTETQGLSSESQHLSAFQCHGTETRREK